MDTMVVKRASLAKMLEDEGDSISDTHSGDESSEKESFIGSGTHSIVVEYKGVAKKQARGKDMEVSLSQLRKEVEVYLECQHPNIIQLLSWEPDFITMTLMEGDLIHMYTYDRKIYITRKRKILLDVAKGLRHMHSVGWAHCDLTQNNVLYKLENDDISCRICDMGFAISQQNLDIGDYWPGTYIYMDYEGMVNQENHTMKACYLTDIWSLGNLGGFLYIQSSFTHRILSDKGLSVKSIQIFDIALKAMKNSTQEEYDALMKLESIPAIITSIMRIAPEERPTLDQIIDRLENEN